MRNIFAKFADFVRESDKVLLLLLFLAAGYGCMAVFSATHYMESLRPFLVHSFCLVAGFGVIFVVSLFEYDRYTKYWPLFAVLGIVPVILTFFIGFAPEGTDDKAWLDLGITTFQPSELLKICFVITFSTHLAKAGKNINKIKTLIPICIHGAIPVLLIHFQGDDGTALVFAVMVVLMLWSAGVSWKYFVAAFSALLVASPIIYFFIMNDTHRERLKNMFDIDADIKGVGWQQYRGRQALANGGLFGQGYLNGDLTQIGKSGVPEGHNDFIFVTIGEELGFFGCLAVIILLGAICIRCLQVAKLSAKNDGKYICVGIFAMLFAQIVINIGMCTSITPVIGVTLPFFSAGGTSLLCLFLGMALVHNVYMNRNSRTISIRG
ncbi:MAG: FtsW/RodA/SpoVE family cell cycle protein [Clostridia bacterium]|nr:FtsW/RodA/SpoVE family cell cycle protein [Clostridia bacterium]